MTSFTGGIRVCFCDLNGHPYDDWGAHEDYCLMLDWALANGKITPAYFEQRFSGSCADLGITGSELEAEARSMPPSRYTFLAAVEDGIRKLTAPRWSPFFGGPPPKVDLPKACYKTASGLPVHIRGACQCKR